MAGKYFITNAFVIFVGLVCMYTPANAQKADGKVVVAGQGSVTPVPAAGAGEKPWTIGASHSTRLNRIKP